MWLLYFWFYEMRSQGKQLNKENIVSIETFYRNDSELKRREKIPWGQSHTRVLQSLQWQDIPQTNQLCKAKILKKIILHEMITTWVIATPLNISEMKV